MSLGKLLFSSDGRIGRKTYWLFSLAEVGLAFLFYGMDLAFGTYVDQTNIGFFYTLFRLLAIGPTIMVGIKRCHDVDHSGWFLLISFVPFLNLWPWFVLPFQAGTIGPNKYGPDPRIPKSFVITGV